MSSLQGSRSQTAISYCAFAVRHFAFADRHSAFAAPDSACAVPRTSTPGGRTRYDSLAWCRTGLIAFAVTLSTLAAGTADAQSLAQPVRIVALTATLQASDRNEPQNFTIRCPNNHIPTSLSVIPAHSDTSFLRIAGRQLIDATGAPIDVSTLRDTAELNGAGHVLSLAAIGEARHRNWTFELMLQCMSALATADDTLVLATTRTFAGAGSTTMVSAFCPADFPVAFTGFSNADGLRLRDFDSAPAWGGNAKVVRASDLADGQTSAPTGWQAAVTHDATTPVAYVIHALCGKAPSAQAFIYSAAMGSGNAFSLFGALSDGWIALGAALDAGSSIAQYAVDAWLKDGSVVGLQPWHSNAAKYDSNAAAPRAFIVRQVDGVRANDSASTARDRVALAIMAIPQPSTPAPPIRVQVIEFYNDHLDHYFVTANPNEIANLENEGYSEWVRTGQTFDAYAVGSSGRTGRRPVCRAYGQPQARLDSHFFSASVDECFATLAEFNGAWTLEASEVFAMDLPDASTGACPDNGVPIYRTWNRRVDSNHRYTTSIGIRDQMIARGHVAEGYGPDAVTLCGLR